METKIKYIPLLLFSSLLASCQTPNRENSAIQKFSKEDSTAVTNFNEVTSIDTTSFTYLWKTNYAIESSLSTIVEVPQGYKRVALENPSFSNWLRHLPINTTNNTVYLYNGEEKYNQNAQFKVIDIDVGKQDLQQCADAVMRLRGEYLFTTKQYDKIHFKYTNGTTIPFIKWGSGFYPSVKGNKVIWISSSNDKSYKSFKKYINNIFMYAGTASLEKEMQSIPLSEIQAGDVFIKGGSPGHAVIVVDVVVNEKTKDKAFLIAQSYMPAQSIHILKNPMNSNLSPWYSLNDINTIIETPEWTFYSNQLKRFIE